MPKLGLRELAGDEKYRPSVVCFTAAVAFSVWYTYGDPNFYLENLANQLTLTRDAVIDAELFRAAGNVFLIVCLGAIIKLAFRQSLVEYGLGIGQWTKAPVLVMATPILILFGYLGANMAEFQAAYPTTPGLTERSMTVFLLHAGVLVSYYIAWEFLFRGFIQKSLVPHLGIVGAIAVQTMASTLAHTGRPSSELLGSIVAGVAWGILAHRTKSIWPGFLQHLLLGLTLDYWICFGGVR